MPDFGLLSSIGADLNSAVLDQTSSATVDAFVDLPVSSTDGDVKYVRNENIYYIYDVAQSKWESIGATLTDANLKFLRKDENLNDIPDKALARQNLGIAAPIDAYTKTETDTLLDGKVDKVIGKDLSTNDFTNTYKSQLDNAPADINSALSSKQDTVTASNGIQKVGVDIQGIDATTSQKGVTQLSNSYSGTSQTLATTEKALNDGLATKQDLNANLTSIASGTWNVGDIPVGNGSGLSEIPAGTNGQILKMVGSDPTWSNLDAAYVGTFNNTTDWGTASGGLYTITITAATHGKGANVSDVSLYETVSGNSVLIVVDTLSINNSTGDVSFSVSETPDGRFTGKVIIIENESTSTVSGGGGISSLNGLTDATQTFSTNGSGIDFNINSSGGNHEFNIPTAALGVRGLVGTGYQTFDGAKTFQNNTSGSAKGFGLYNADTTDNNQLTINFETDTTGTGAQQAYATTFFGSQVKDHNHSTVTANVTLSTYVNGTQKTVLSTDENLNLYTDYKPQFNNGMSLNGNLQVNNGFVSGGQTLNVLSGQGFNQSMNNIGGQINVPAGSSITGTNIFGTNLAQGFVWSEDIDGGVVPFLGLSAVGYVGYIIGSVSGKTLETINMAIAGLSDQGSVAGAIVNNLNMYTAGGLIGSTPVTINNMRMFYTPSVAGGVATNEWGVAIDAPIDNYFDKSITIGGGAGSKTTNNDIALEIKSQKAFKLANLTTSQKNAISSPEAGMMIFDTDLSKVCVYSGSTWETITSI